MKYRREIDGLRALAVIPVIFFHAGFEAFAGGFVGVDVFLVISGYLITTIILAELETGKFSVANFYERRARRILPALFLVMAACLPFAWLWLLPGDMRDFSQSVAAVAVFASNILFWQETGYFDTAAELKPLLHTWSLAVEEQFYVLFPLFLMYAWRLGRRWMISILAAIAILSLAAAHWGSLRDPDATFFLLPTRGWELSIGAFIALYFAQHPLVSFAHRINQTLSTLGLLLIVYSIIAFSKETPFPSLYALMPTVGTALIILFAWPQTIVGKLLGSRALVGIGVISYSAYLWHQPLFAFARHRAFHEPTATVFVVLSLVALVMAYFSWVLVERPFRRKSTISRKQVFAFALAGSVAFFAIGFTGYSRSGFTERFAHVPYRDLTGFPELDSGYCFYSVDSRRNLPVGEDGLRCWLGDADSSIKGILFGDSFAGHFEPLWDIVGGALGVGINAVTTNWCIPSNSGDFTGPTSSRAHEQCALNQRYLMENASKYDFVILSGNWEAVYSQKRLSGVMSAVEYLSGVVRLVILMPVPKLFDANVGRLYLKHELFGVEFDINQFGQGRDVGAAIANDILKSHAESLPNAIFIDRDALFSLAGKPSDVTADGIPYSLDGRHISIYGSTKAAESLMSSAGFALLEARFQSMR